MRIHVVVTLVGVTTKIEIMNKCSLEHQFYKSWEKQESDILKTNLTKSSHHTSVQKI